MLQLASKFHYWLSLISKCHYWLPTDWQMSKLADDTNLDWQMSHILCSPEIGKCLIGIGQRNNLIGKCLDWQMPDWQKSNWHISNWQRSHRSMAIGGRRIGKWHSIP